MPWYFPSWFPRKDTTPPQSHNTPEVVPDTSPVTSSDSLWTRRHNDTLPPAADLCLVFALGAASGAGALLAWRRWGMRLSTAEWITPNELARRRWIRGVVTSVGDADDFRLYHTPGIGWRWPLKLKRVPTKRKDLKDQTIHVRIAGVDAPEGAHYGRPGQPHAEESLTWLRKRILGKTLYCRLIRKDQYGRIVGVPLVPQPFLPLFLAKYLGSSLALEMLRAGTATTYEESGAETARRGMWKNGVNIEMPGEYKKRYAAALGEKEDTSGSDKKRLLSRLTSMLR
ncbi:hypothetical protein EV363DRAFT_1452177 [Boletus edulis]|nr:hypothetical protein EV363DRAFT_1452177 [Boletus edulis]